MKLCFKLVFTWGLFLQFLCQILFIFILIDDTLLELISDWIEPMVTLTILFFQFSSKELIILMMIFFYIENFLFLAKLMIIQSKWTDWALSWSIFTFSNIVVGRVLFRCILWIDKLARLTFHLICCSWVSILNFSLNLET